MVGQIYDELLEQYSDPDYPYSLESINQLCVCSVFCFYAEDAGLFGRKEMFQDYLADFNTRYFRNAIIDLFRIVKSVFITHLYLDHRYQITGGPSN